jgi:pimeloyl-ACP methyl ester carboxylesterase
MTTSLIEPRVVDGIDVHIEGTGARTLLMLHGWPDTLALWGPTVAALREGYRCVRLTLPGFEAGTAAGAMSLKRMTELLRKVIDAVSPEAPVTLVLHDWGSVFGFELAARHPERVAGIVAVDVGDHNSPAFAQSATAQAKLQIFAYQIWLALAWMLGRAGAHRLAKHMTRTMARAMRCPTPAEQIVWTMNYPYAMRWLGVAGGLGRAAQVQPACPLLYLYGKRKPFMFHSPQWLAWLQQRPGSAAKALACGHWVMVDKAPEFVSLVRQWLQATDPPDSD